MSVTKPSTTQSADVVKPLFAGGGTASAVQYVSISGGVKYDPQGFENSAPTFSGTNSRIMTLDIDEATGVLSDPVNMYGYTLPLLDADGNAMTWGRGDIIQAYLLTNLAPTANVEPCIIVHDGSGGPLDASAAIGGSLDLSTNWRVNSQRCVGSGYTVRASSAVSASTQGLCVEYIQGSGSSTRLTASARDSAFAAITTANTGTVDDTVTALQFTHVTIGVMVTGAYTGTVSLVGGVYAVSTTGAVDSLP